MLQNNVSLIAAVFPYFACIPSSDLKNTVKGQVSPDLKQETLGLKIGEVSR